MSPVTDILNKTIPSPAAAVVLSIGLAGTVAPWLSAVERASTQWLGVPSDRLLEAQLILSLGIFGLASFVAFILMVLAYKKLQRDHADELQELERKRIAPAATQGGNLVTRRTRAQLLRDWEIDR